MLVHFSRLNTFKKFLQAFGSCVVINSYTPLECFGELTEMTGAGLLHDIVVLFNIL